MLVIMQMIVSVVIESLPAGDEAISSGLLRRRCGSSSQ